MSSQSQNHHGQWPLRKLVGASAKTGAGAFVAITAFVWAMVLSGLFVLLRLADEPPNVVPTEEAPAVCVRRLEPPEDKPYVVEDGVAPPPDGAAGAERPPAMPPGGAGR